MPTTSGGHAARRILLYGVTGSGKSSAAERIGRAAGLPVHLADELTWEPGWVQVAEDEQRRRFEAICAQDSWVLDTAYGSWTDVPLARVEVIVGLDYPRWLSFGRLVRRTIQRISDRRPVCNGNVEKWWMALTRESILLWHVTSFARKRRRMRSWAAAPDGPPIMLCRRPRDLDRWVGSLTDR